MHHFRVALVLGVLFSMASGCLRVGLPEHVSGASYFQDHRQPGLPTPPINTILINSAEKDPNRAIGRQFVLLIFPISRVYLEHGFKRMAAEMLTEEFSSKGLVVAETDSLEKGLALFRATPSASRLILLQHASVSASAYDLLFTRRTAVEGSIYLSLLSPHDGSPVASEVLDLQEGDFRSTAFGPALTNLIERGIRRSIETSTLLKVEPPRTSPMAEQIPTCLVPPPQLPAELPASFADRVTLSYGFKQLKPFDVAQLSRMIQRGILTGLNRLDIACGITSGAENHTRSAADRLTFRFSEIDLAADGSQLTAQVESNAGNGVAALTVPIRSDVDGSLAFALEELGNDAVAALNLGLVRQERR